MERRAILSSAKREVERIGTRIKKLLNLMLDDEIAVEEGKTEIKTLDATGAARDERRAACASASRDGRAVPPEGDEARRGPGALRDAHGGYGGAAKADRRHCPDADELSRAPDRAERGSGCDAERRHKCEEGRQKRATSRCKYLLVARGG